MTVYITMYHLKTDDTIQYNCIRYSLVPKFRSAHATIRLHRWGSDIYIDREELAHSL